MNRSVFTVMLLFCMGYTATVSANSQANVNSRSQQCYAMAMLGKDTVINARLGLPPEHALELTKLTSSSKTEQNKNEVKFDNTALDIMLAAYLWHGTPQGYAASVLRDCVKGH